MGWVRWKSVPNTDPWEEQPAPKPDPWATGTLLIAVIVIAVVAVLAVAGLYVWVIANWGSR